MQETLAFDLLTTNNQHSHFQLYTL